MESGLAKRLVQVGIRTINRHQREQANKFGVEVVEMRALPAYGCLKAAGPVFIFFDLDAPDPAFCPAISPPEPGRISGREAMGYLRAIQAGIACAHPREHHPVP